MFDHKQHCGLQAAGVPAGCGVENSVDVWHGEHCSGVYYEQGGVVCRGIRDSGAPDSRSLAKPTDGDVEVMA